MSHIDKLLSLDALETSKLPTKKIEIKRLSEKLGEPYEITIQALSNEDYRQAQKRANNIKKKGKIDFNSALFQSIIITKGIIEPDLTNEKLLNHYGCYSSTELADKIFLSGEQSKIVEEIQKLGGHTDDDDEDEDMENTIKKQ